MIELPDFTPYTVEDLTRLLAAARVALANKRTITAAAEQIDAILASVKAAQGVADGSPWVQPTGAQDAYPRGAHVTYDGKIWTSLVTANVWTPGVSGWREYVAPGSVPAWIQPTGSHDVYNLGDRVTHAGKVWVSTVAANVWEPGVYGWQEVTTANDRTR